MEHFTWLRSSLALAAQLLSNAKPNREYVSGSNVRRYRHRLELMVGADHTIKGSDNSLYYAALGRRGLLIVELRLR